MNCLGLGAVEGVVEPNVNPLTTGALDCAPYVNPLTTGALDCAPDGAPDNNLLVSLLLSSTAIGELNWNV